MGLQVGGGKAGRREDSIPQSLPGGIGTLLDQTRGSLPLLSTQRGHSELNPSITLSAHYRGPRAEKYHQDPELQGKGVLPVCDQLLWILGSLMEGRSAAPLIPVPSLGLGAKVLHPTLLSPTDGEAPQLSLIP